VTLSLGPSAHYLFPMTDSADLRRQLLALIGAMRKRVDPTTLEVAGRFAEAAQAERQGLVLYDRDQAQQAVKLFLDTRRGDVRFRTKLAEALKRPQSDD
jgi:hypothetical protein